MIGWIRTWLAKQREQTRRNTGLWMALASRNAGELRALLEAGADPNTYATPTDLDCPLICASRRGWTTGVSVLLEFGARINERGDGDETALMAAAYNGEVEVIKLLLAHGADSNARSKNGETALKLARTGRFPERREAVVSLLLSAGAKEE
jgi:ankyrin repeat protein